ncbi:MAG: class C sortase [Lachnospiraceae bacterium]|nr:class C sortase [Lachnospiraceae bacterium]
MKRAIIILIILIAGIGLLSYPFISNYLTELNGSDAIQEFNAQFEQQEDADTAVQRTLAEEYNASLTGQSIKDPFVSDSGIVQPDNYDEILDYANHMMGYIEIPKINIYLPIYHGVADDVLNKGVGHMSQTAFPIGGEGNHAVLTGHSALPEAKLFTDLTELTEGDTFYIHILNETLAYQVDNITIVEPENTENLHPVAGEDYVTLITCTPYAVNSHRLLVRGMRIPYTEEQHQEEIKNGGMIFAKVDTHAVFVGVVVAGIMLVIIVLVIIRRRRNNKN